MVLLATFGWYLGSEGGLLWEIPLPTGREAYAPPADGN